MAERHRNPSAFAPIPGLDYPINVFPTQRRVRQGSSRLHTQSHSSTTYSPSHVGYNNNSVSSTASPTFSSAFPFFSVSNGPGSVNHGPMSSQDVDALTAGAPMSPSANNYLPSDLLDNDDLPVDKYMSVDGLATAVPSFYRRSSADQDPQSPISVHSQSPSLISSPQESLSNVHNIYSSRDALADSERHSLASTGSPYSHGVTVTSNPGPSRKFGSFFAFNRQRGKNTEDTLPPLGSLKPSQSQSFPTNLDQEPGSAGSGRRSMWPNPFSKAATTGISPEGADNITRKPRRGMFGSKLEPLETLDNFDRSSSPRPSSTYSHERALPRPNSEYNSLFGWGADPARQRGSPLGGDWGAAPGGVWSRSQSRRQSLQHGSTSNLSIGTTPILDGDDYSSPYNNKISKPNQPAPIGTERFSLTKRAAPKLNPAAPSFSTRLFNRNDSKKTPKHDKSQETPTSASSDKLKSKASKEYTDPAFLSEDSSPPVSRLSRDAHSIMTSGSIGESHDSLDYTISATASETAGTPSSSTPKESLMQKITRKSSSSKFVPWSKDRNSIFSKKQTGEPYAGGEMDEDAANEYLGKPSSESGGLTPNSALGEKAPRTSLSWSRVMGKSKMKKGDLAPSESSERAPSETDGGDDDEEKEKMAST